MLRITAMMTLLLATLAGPAIADTSGTGATANTPSAQILATLIDRGYRILEDERTWLGRQRIIAEKDGTRRELVFHPGTGEILRDYSVRIEMAGTLHGAGDGGGAGATQPSVGVTARPGQTGALGSAPGLSVSESFGDMPGFSTGQSQE
jgi:hypothetical protein